MRKAVAALMAAGPLLAGTVLAGVATATPALAQSRPITLLCSPGSNGGTLVNGTCVLPAATVGQPYEGFLLTSNGAVDTFTITSGSLPPGLSMPATYGEAGTIVGGTPSAAGTFTFSVHVTKFGTSTPSTNGTFSITVGGAAPLAITFPATCCTAGTVGSSYFQNFFTSGGVGPFTWTVAAGQLPPGVVLTTGHLGGTPTTAGTFTFTLKATDSAGHQATEAGSITISRLARRPPARIGEPVAGRGIPRVRGVTSERTVDLSRVTRIRRGVRDVHDYASPPARRIRRVPSSSCLAAPLISTGRNLVSTPRR